MLYSARFSLIIVHLLRPSDLYDDGPSILGIKIFSSGLQRQVFFLFFVFVIAFYKGKKFVKLPISLYIFFKNTQKLVKVKIGLLFTTLKPYLVTNLQENLILERKLVILSRRRKRKIKQ